MQGPHAWRRTGFIAAFTIFPLVLGGCLEHTTTDATSSDVENHLTGSVGDGPVVGASMQVMANDGSVLEQFVSDSLADYDAMVKTKGDNYPLTIEADDGTDLVTNLPPELTLYGCVANPSKNTRQNVNLFSTLAVEIARDMAGGMTKSNCAAAEQSAIAIFNAGLSSLKSTGPSSSKIDGSNAAEIVKASETLSEIVKRTRNYQQMFGHSSSANQVLRELGSDALDDIIDGRGGSGVDPRTAAIATIATVQAYLEAASNELRVNGAIATDAMNSAIDQVTDGSMQETVGDQTVTAEMLTAIDVGMSAAYEVVPTQKVLDLWRATSGVQAGMEDTFVQTLLPDDYVATLDGVLMTVAGGSSTTVNTVNDVVRSGGNQLPSSTPSPNSPPTISGNPPTSVTVGSQYFFTPTANDADGDSLSFTVNNLPAWADFDNSTGNISGTPADNDVGSYTGITITVSDGTDSSALGPFSISVNAVSGGNTAPTISGSPPGQVNVGSLYSFTPNASDADGDSLSFTVNNLPSWATFDAQSGGMTGTPDVNAVGTYDNIVISVSDGLATASLRPFSVTVNDLTGGNTPPVIGGNPPRRVTVGNTYSFTPSASDADGDSMIFSISGQPSWASFNTQTGRLSGTPSAGQVGTYGNIVISVSDGLATAALPAFSITVDAVGTNAGTFPIYPIYKDFMTLWRGTPVPETNTRYWEETPAYPACGSISNSVPNLNSAISGASAGDVLCLQDGTYNNQDITINKNGVIVEAQTKNGVRFTGDSNITINGNNVDVFGFEWSNTSISTNDLIRINGDDVRVCYINQDNVSGGGRRVLIDGQRARYCYSTFDFKNTDGSYIHASNASDPPIYSRIDHNQLLNFSGSTGGSSEAIQVGQSSPYVDYFWLIDSNYVAYTNNDGAGHRVNFDEAEWLTIKSRSVLLMHNYFACNIGRGGSRAGTQVAFYANFVNGCNAEHASGIHMQGKDDYVIANYCINGNTETNNTFACIEARGGDNRTYTNGVYLPADNINIAFNTSHDWGSPLNFAKTGGSLHPNDGILDNNAFERRGSGNTVGADNHGTGWSSSGNVLEPQDGTDLAVTSAMPDLGLDSGTSSVYMPTASGNLSGTAASGFTSLATYDILGQPIPPSGGNIGAVQGQPTLTSNPMQDIVDASGVNGS